MVGTGLLSAAIFSPFFSLSSLFLPRISEDDARSCNRRTVKGHFGVLFPSYVVLLSKGHNIMPIFPSLCSSCRAYRETRRIRLLPGIPVTYFPSPSPWGGDDFRCGSASELLHPGAAAFRSAFFPLFPPPFPGFAGFGVAELRHLALSLLFPSLVLLDCAVEKGEQSGKQAAGNPPSFFPSRSPSSYSDSTVLVPRIRACGTWRTASRPFVEEK